MDLFQLLGTISINNSDANKALEETSNTGQKAESKLGKAFKAVGKGAVVVGKTIATGMAVGATAVGALVTKSIQSYADYEQLVGGVETLFKDSAEKVQAYAANAYKTAGLSANEYMETVTSFSASLLQSLDGDTNKAAEYANMAITDMSDNANKMGTDMSLIQNAYQGFAKANYTMLDNLKLGYGGTKEEMARLLADAQAISGIEYDISSYADIVDAIHVIQTEMGITGTTAKEASSTISGSLASMKSSWQNLLTAISSDELPFDVYVKNFVDSVSTVADNLMPRISIALTGVVNLIQQLAPVIGNAIPDLLSQLLPAITNAATSLVGAIVQALPDILNGILAAVPGLIQGIMELFSSLVTALPQVFKLIVDALPGLITQIGTALPTLIPQLISAVVQMVLVLCENLVNIIQPIIEAIPGILMSIVNALMTNLPVLINGLVSLINMIVEQLPVLLPVLLQAIVTIVTMLIEQLPVLIPMLVNAIMSIISMLAEQLPVLIPMLVDALITIVYLLIDNLPIIIPMLIEACITIVMAIIQALPGILTALTDALPVILQAVWDAIVMIFTNLPQWFGQIFQGAVDIIKTAWSVVAGFFKGIWNAICQVFAPVGQWFSGIFQGAWNGIKNIWSAVTGFFSGIWNGIKTAFSAVGSWFSNMFSGAWNGIKSIWSGVTSFFSGIWNGIKNAFSAVTNFFKNAFSNAWNAIKNVFSGVSSFFTGIWDKIKSAFSAIGTKIGDAISGAVRSGINGLLGSAENIINGFLGMINGAIDLINKIPGVNISKVKLVSFTRLAEGGVVDKATPAVFGEDGAEAVVPLEKNTGWLNKVAKQLHEFSLETKNDLSGELSTRSVELQQQQVSEMQTLNEKVDRIISLLVQFFPDVLASMDQVMVLDDGTLVARTAPAMDVELAKIAIKKGRGR